MSTAGTLEAINAIILNPAYQEYFAILKGARNGLVYGAKIRFPHALVMSVLFGRGDALTRAKSIFRATRTHALNLAKFVTIYKTLLLLQKRSNGGKERTTDTFFAGLIGGYIVFGERTAINEQIVLYVVSRVVASFLPRASPYPPAAGTKGPNGTNKPLPPSAPIFSAFAALSWGAVMWLFREREETLQPGMWSSMRYLYLDSERWKDLRTLLWHNE
ncbi:peroxisomal membrane protein 4 [Clavulina sp. PMI_390]|nr:peroxisomal membrane protein 4 [Clavulina sp. PMI_390]